MGACFGDQNSFINNTPFYRLFQERLDTPSSLFLLKIQQKSRSCVYKYWLGPALTAVGG